MHFWSAFCCNFFQLSFPSSCVVAQWNSFVRRTKRFAFRRPQFRLLFDCLFCNHFLKSDVCFARLLHRWRPEMMHTSTRFLCSPAVPIVVNARFCSSRDLPALHWFIVKNLPAFVKSVCDYKQFDVLRDLCTALVDAGEPPSRKPSSLE
jgi:hypothetical protein